MSGKYEHAPTETVDVGGTSFVYRELGPRGGTPLVFLHHFTAVLDDWDPRVIDGIAAHRRVITFDNRGIGATDGKVPNTLDAMADDAAAFIRALGHEKVDLIGFSIGGGVAQEVTLANPELVRRLILAGCGLLPRRLIGRVARRLVLTRPRLRLVRPLRSAHRLSW